MINLVYLFEIIYFRGYERVPACMYGYHMHAVSKGATRGRWTPGTRVVKDCEPPCGCWKFKRGPLEEQHVLFTAEI